MLWVCLQFVLCLASSSVLTLRVGPENPGRYGSASTNYPGTQAGTSGMFLALGSPFDKLFSGRRLGKCEGHIFRACLALGANVGR